ncbi:MAG: Na+/H+ antiporter NhaA [Bacteroidota bacterium]
MLSETFKRFLKFEISGSTLLLLMTVIALAWANSPFADSYNALWHYKLEIGIGGLMLSKTLIHWINDGLMALFFFLIGLEIKREIAAGELTSARKAALPVFAAIGGMTVPLILYLLINNNVDAARGWAIPMATDIAFSLAVLQMLGKRVPTGIKIFLTAFAIVDDIGAVLVIAIFYSANIQVLYLVLSLAIWAILMAASLFRRFNIYIFILAGFAVWLLMLKSGLHPTIAGILLAFAVPLQQKRKIKDLTGRIQELLPRLSSPNPLNEKGLLSHDQLEAINDLEDCALKIQSPLQELENKLHGWVSYLIIPLFALANAGVSISGGAAIQYNLILAIGIALILGNITGISLFSLGAVRLKLAELPEGAGMRDIFGTSFLGGIGFTMSLFIVNLAFTDQAMIDSAKLGILAGSLVSGLGGYLFIRLANRRSGQVPGTYGQDG